jgi:hypothetical protein
VSGARLPWGRRGTWGRCGARTLTGMRPTRVCLVLLALVLLAGGCTSSAAPEKVDPSVWAGKVCQALGPWRAHIGELTRQAQREMSAARTPEQTKTNLVRLLGGAERASEDARSGIVAAGVPGVPQGARIRDRFIGSLGAVRDAYGRARRTIEALDTSDASAFYDRVVAAWDRLTDEYSRTGLDTGAVSSAELKRAFDEVPDCR